MSILNDLIARENARFAVSTPEQQKRIVAADVLDAMVAGQIKAERAQYFWDDTEYADENGASGSDKPLYDRPLHERSLDSRFKCSACAIGSTWLALMRRTNGASSDGPEEMRTKLTEVFTGREIAMMETAFEGDVIFGTLEQFGIILLDDPEVNDARRWCDAEDDNDALAAIMLNVVVNGTFNIDDDPVDNALSIWRFATRR